MSAQQGARQILGILTSLFLIIYWYLEALFRQFVPPSMKSIDGETILITGAAGGIGKEFCRYLIKCGTNLKLVILDLNLTDLEKLAAELESNGDPGLKVFPFAFDISSRENIEAGCKQIKEQVGPVTIIFNNAGIAPPGNFLQLTNSEFEKTIQINLMSHFWIIREFLPGMITNDHGRIVNMCSLGGLKAATHSAPYYASKFAVNGYTESLKTELRCPQYNYDGIKFSTVYPFLVRTPLLKSLDMNDKAVSRLPTAFQRFLKPEDVARKAVDGMRREYEYIYLPAMIPFLVVMEFFIPRKLRLFMESQLFTTYSYKNAEEQERLFNTPYLVSTNSSYKNGKALKSQ